MCVILVAERKALPMSLAQAAMDANPHGNGLAWITGKGKHKTVRFEKGLTRREAIKLLTSKKPLPLPYVFHARIASVGHVCDELTHPFPVAPRKEQIETSGSTRKGVVFHNGTWHGWSAYYSKGKAPVETPWSDSRAMADLVYELGEQMLAVVPESEKIARMTVSGVELYGRGWVEVQKGVMASNRYFLPVRASNEHLQNLVASGRLALGEIEDGVDPGTVPDWWRRALKTGR